MAKNNNAYLCLHIYNDAISFFHRMHSRNTCYNVKSLKPELNFHLT